jgi:hypothetical protein
VLDVAEGFASSTHGYGNPSLSGTPNSATFPKHPDKEIHRIVIINICVQRAAQGRGALFVSTVGSPIPGCARLLEDHEGAFDVLAIQAYS